MRELRTFLHAHVAQNEDNARLASRKQKPNQNEDTHNSLTGQTFFQWVRTTSADHTSCPYSFSFVSSLLSAHADGAECFSTVSEKYFAADLCRHLATMCRMYNDYGSLARDQAECNLNSVDFPEFEGMCATERKKEALFALAEYERSCLNKALQHLDCEARKFPTHGPGSGQIKERQMDIWRMFCDVTDLYGQIYVVRDIASRMVVSAVTESK